MQAHLAEVVALLNQSMQDYPTFTAMLQQEAQREAAAAAAAAAAPERVLGGSAQGDKGGMQGGPRLPAQWQGGDEDLLAKEGQASGMGEVRGAEGNFGAEEQGVEAGMGGGEEEGSTGRGDLGPSLGGDCEDDIMDLDAQNDEVGDDDGGGDGDDDGGKKV